MAGIHAESNNHCIESIFEDGVFHGHDKMLQLSSNSVDPRALSNSIEVPVQDLILLTQKKEAAKCARKALKRKNTRERAKAKKIQVRSAWEVVDAELNAMDGDSFEEEIFKEPEDHEHRVEKIAEYELEDGPVRESEAAILPVPAAVVPPESGRARQTRQKVVFEPHSGCSAGCCCPIVNTFSSSKAGRKKSKKNAIELIRQPKIRRVLRTIL